MLGLGRRQAMLLRGGFAWCDSPPGSSAAGSAGVSVSDSGEPPEIGGSDSTGSECSPAGFDSPLVPSAGTS